jgi:hypothetical protein
MMIDNAEALRFEFKQQPCHLERLYGIVTDLYIDKFKYQVSSCHHVGLLSQLRLSETKAVCLVNDVRSRNLNLTG